MKKIQTLLFVSLLITSLIACTNDQAEEPSLCGELSNISFAAEIVPILATYCYFPNQTQSCHVANGTAPTDFTTYQGVFDSKVSMDNRVIVVENMPPSYSDGPKDMQECDKATLAKWLEEGALDN